MKNSFSLVFEMILGAIIFIVGMYFLLSNERILSKLTDATNSRMVENQDFYQQTNDLDVNMISDEELYAIVIGCREYPIAIDGTVISSDGTNYESYVTLIQEGLYIKSYNFDATNNICLVKYTYNGI